MSSDEKSKKRQSFEMPFNMILEGGYSYLIKDDNTNISSHLVLNNERINEKILFITRNPPDEFKSKNEDITKSLIWLTFNKGPNCIEPTNITRLSVRIQDFLKRNKEATILFDGLEYLSSQNDFSTILHFLQLVNDKIMISDSKLILAIDPSAFKPRELALIEREMELLDDKVKVEIAD